MNFFLKFSSDYWGGKKGVLPPILIIGGARARAAPRVYAYGREDKKPLTINNFFIPRTILTCNKSRGQKTIIFLKKFSQFFEYLPLGNFWLMFDFKRAIFCLFTPPYYTVTLIRWVPEHS